MMPNSASHDGNYLRRPPILKADQEMSEHNTRRLTEVERAVLWEVDMARQCVHNFGKMSSAHSIILSLLVTVNLIGFLQPPKGWDSDSDQPNSSMMSNQPDSSMMYATAAVRCFSITNALSVYSAITGLLFYIYCSYTSILPLGTFPLPMGMGPERYDERAIELLHQTRAFLRCMALPAIRRRSIFQFSFLTLSLLFSGMAFISAGTAAVGPHDWVIIGPALPGCACVLLALGITARKYWEELQFDKPFDFFWKNVARIDERCIPELVSIDDDDHAGLDPIPFRWVTKYIAPYECKRVKHGKRRHPSQLLDEWVTWLMARCGRKCDKHSHPSHTHMV